MDTFPKIEINPAGTLVTIRYCGHITASDLQANLVDAALSTLDSMDQSCASVLGQIMDRIDSYGVGTIIRVIPESSESHRLQHPFSVSLPVRYYHYHMRRFSGSFIFT